MTRSEEKPARRLAPIAIFGSILFIAIATVAVVAIGQCGGQELIETIPAREIAPGVYVPVETPPR